MAEPLDNSMAVLPDVYLTTQDHQNAIIAEAMKLSHERLVSGSASSQEIIWWLNRGTPEVQLKQEQLQYQNELLIEKRKAIQSQAESDVDYRTIIDLLTGRHRKDVTDETDTFLL